MQQRLRRAEARVINRALGSLICLAVLGLAAVVSVSWGDIKSYLIGAPLAELLRHASVAVGSLFLVAMAIGLPRYSRWLDETEPKR